MHVSVMLYFLRRTSVDRATWRPTLGVVLVVVVPFSRTATHSRMVTRIAIIGVQPGTVYPCVSIMQYKEDGCHRRSIVSAWYSLCDVCICTLWQGHKLSGAIKVKKNMFFLRIIYVGPVILLRLLPVLVGTALLSRTEARYRTMTWITKRPAWRSPCISMMKYRKTTTWRRLLIICTLPVRRMCVRKNVMNNNNFTDLRPNG